MFEELIASRSSKVREILKYKGQIVTMTQPVAQIPGNRILAMHPRTRFEATIEECTPYFVRWLTVSDNRYQSESLENITISRDETRHRLQLNIQRHG